MTVDWNDLLLAYLHDPPDKALSIRGHVPRARNNAQIAVGDHVSRTILEDAVSAADPLASIIERFPMPKAGGEGQHAVGPDNSELLIVHPLSSAKTRLPVPELNDQLTQTQQDRLRTIVAALPGDGDQQAKNRLFSIWRLWPDDLAMSIDECLALLPADTRTPDHTIWNHLDITAAFKAADSEGGGAALLAFALGPVQRFIEASRSVRDLWSGSMILSWLAFRSLLPIVEKLGPTALVYPALRGNPLLDLWLADEKRLGGKVPPLGVHQCLTPSLPHRFLAIVPWGANGATGHALADECRVAFVRAWQEMASGVKQRVQQSFDSLSPGWDKRWGGQISEYFSASTAVVPLGGAGEEVDNRLARLLAGQDSFGIAFGNAEAVRELARSIPDGDRPTYDQDHAGRWQYQVELAGRSLASKRSIRHVPVPSGNGSSNVRIPQKCSLLGSFEQMGPDELQASKDFWDNIAAQTNGLSIDGVRVRQGEALCAVAVVKRFAAPTFLREQLQLQVSDLRFPDTWTVAAAQWLATAGIDWRADWRDATGRHVPWNGHWLQWSKSNQNLEDADACPDQLWSRLQEARKPENHGPAPIYYAILKFDGDDLGGWLRGENSPAVRETMHPNLVRYYEGLGDQARGGLDAKRPVGPALHAAISTALSNFALHVVPAVVEKHHGTVIYSGGDDTLILLPVSTALACATELRNAYMSDWYAAAGGRKYLLMGTRATLSGGLVVVHAKDDLRLALADARAAEKQAKDAGKDALCIAIRRRSGERTSAFCPWSFAPLVANWAEQFQIGASDRWAYHLYATRQTLEGLPVDAIKAEMRRQLSRAEPPTPDLISPSDFADAFDLFRQCRAGENAGSRFGTIEEALQQFLTLCHTASFLARGRDA